MPYEHFALLFLENFGFNLFIVFLTMTSVLLVYKKNIYSLFDPLLFFLIFSSAGYSVVFILFFSGDIKLYYVVHFLLTQAFLIFGFLLFKPVNLKKIRKPEHFFYLRISKRVKVIYLLSSFFYLISHLLLYTFKGIPLFMPSRLDATVGGFGFIASISSTTSVIILSYLSYKFLLGFKFKIFDYLIFFLFIIFSILSGSKSVFISAIFVGFYVAYFISVKLSIPTIMQKFNKASFKIFLLAFITLIILTILLTDEHPLIRIVFRIIMTGDIYMMSYVDDNINLIEGNFFNLVLPYRLVDILGLEHVRVIGNQLVEIVYGIEQNTGPNARHNVLGYVAFGYFGAIIFSFLLGTLIGFLRNKLIKLVKGNLESLIFFVLILSNVFSLEADLSYAVFSYISELIVFSLIYTVSSVLVENKKRTF
ncbi:O-antigen polymerase [Thermodesulfovibrio thiophilus]|uniref:O-antigen polymerase n=1 Tax=Thermodesulfovibrio thiophilus TaxID=340095 RepID=UPI00040BF72D|nr:O-antigen polymerase [Thermodesulfovibrio thiophilus]